MYGIHLYDAPENPQCRGVPNIDVWIVSVRLRVVLVYLYVLYVLETVKRYIRCVQSVGSRKPGAHPRQLFGWNWIRTVRRNQCGWGDSVERKTWVKKKKVCQIANNQPKVLWNS